MTLYPPDERERKDALSGTHLPIGAKELDLIIEQVENMAADVTATYSVKKCDCCGRDYYTDLAAHRHSGNLTSAITRLMRVLEAVR